MIVVEVEDSYYVFQKVLQKKQLDSKKMHGKIHSEKNAISTADRILFPLIKELGINEEVNINLFRDCVKKYHIGDYQSVREAVFNEYSQK